MDSVTRYFGLKKLVSGFLLVSDSHLSYAIRYNLLLYYLDPFNESSCKSGMIGTCIYIIQVLLNFVFKSVEVGKQLIQKPRALGEHH